MDISGEMVGVAGFAVNSMEGAACRLPRTRGRVVAIAMPITPGTLPPRPAKRQTPGPHPECDVPAAPLLIVAVVATVLAIAIYRRSRRVSPHQQAVRDVLDAADALEDRLRTARAELEAIAGEGGTGAIANALKEMLRQRLWLRDHGAGATPQQLLDVRAAIDDARKQIDDQLALIERARIPNV